MAISQPLMAPLGNVIGDRSQRSKSETHPKQASEILQTKVGKGMVSEAKSRTHSVVSLATVLLIMCGCQGLQSSNVTSVGNGSITSVNHIIFMAQENRSFDT